MHVICGFEFVTGVFEENPPIVRRFSSKSPVDNASRPRENPSIHSTSRMERVSVPCPLNCLRRDGRRATHIPSRCPKRNIASMSDRSSNLGALISGEHLGFEAACTFIHPLSLLSVDPSILASSTAGATNNSVTGPQETVICFNGNVTGAGVPIMSASPRHITIESSIPVLPVSFPAEDNSPCAEGSLPDPDTFSEFESQSVVDKSSIIEGSETPKHRGKRRMDESEDEFINNVKERTKCFNNQKATMKSQLDRLCKKTGCYGILYLRRYSSCCII